MFNITARSLSLKNVTVSFDSDQIIPTLGEQKVEEVVPVRGTAYIGGFYKDEKSGANCFFVKPNMGSRATDCIGSRGPKPTQVHVVGENLIMFSWHDSISNKDSTKMFNRNGRYFGSVLQPMKKSSIIGQKPTRYENLVPIKGSYDSHYFLLARKKSENVWEGGVSKLLKKE